MSVAADTARPVAMRVFVAGICCAVAYVLISAAGEVFAAAMFQVSDMYTNLLIAFILVACCFNVVPGNDTEGSVLRSGKALMVGLNVVTAVNWLGLFIGLKYAEPAVVVSFIVAVSPIAVVWINCLLRDRTPPARDDLLASIAVATIGVYLGWISVSGRSALAVDSVVYLGLAASVLAGVSIATSNVMMKMLFEKGIPGRDILAHRFYGTILILLFLVDLDNLSIALTDHVGVSIIIALSTVIVPIVLIQMSIKRIEPFVVNMILASAPLVTYLVQLLDSRLVPSNYTLAGNVAIMAVAVYSIVSHARRLSA